MTLILHLQGTKRKIESGQSELFSERWTLGLPDKYLIIPLILIMFFLGSHIAEACKYSIRDVGFVDLDLRPYQLYLFSNHQLYLTMFLLWNQILQHKFFVLGHIYIYFCVSFLKWQFNMTAKTHSSPNNLLNAI